MAHLSKLPDDARASLARQIAERLKPAAQKHIAAAERDVVAREEPIELGEDFEVWTLGLDAAKTFDSPLESLATRTGYWHHLIRRGGRAGEFAASKLEGANQEWRVHALFSSQLAEQIDRAIQWVDANDTSNATVRLLFVPACALYAFWFLGDGGERIVVVSMPNESGKLRYEQFYRTRQFLELLVQQPAISPFPPRPRP